MTNDTDLTTSTIRNSLVVIRDLLKKSRENGDAELHWIQINRLFEELKSDVLPLVENEKSQGVEFEEMPIVKLLKEIDDSVWFPLAWEYKQDLTFRSVKEEFEISDCIPEIPDAPFPQDMVDCAFITDDGYVNMTAVAINSIRRTRNPKTKIRIHVVAAALSEYSEKLFKLFEETDFSIDVVRIEKSVLEKLSSYHQYIKGGHCMATPAALLKFALPELLPNLNRVLYLDGDTLILRDLKTLFQTKLGENYVAAVTDSWVATNDGDTIQVLGKWLFNSGMMLLNLSLMRKHNMSKTLLDAKKRSTDYRLMDQPIFNTLLAGRVRFVDYRYNFLPVWYWRKKGLLKKEEFKNKFSEIYGKTLSEPEEMLSTDITIAHFAGSDKPWTNSQLPFAKEWLDRAAELDEMRLREFVTGDFQPTVSIIIPVYNVEKYLQECLDSIIKQNLKEIEIICIDDGSTDSSPVILKEYAAQDPRIKILKQQNRGQGAARNLGIKKARGKYIGFVDSDDWVSKNYFEKLFTAAQKNNADVTSTTGVFLSCGTKADVRKSVGIELGTNLLSDLDRYATILTTGITVNKLYRRDFLTDNNILFPEKRVFGEDNFVVFFSVMLANKIACVHDANYYYRQRENSTVTQQISDWFFTIIDAYRVIFDRIKTSNLNAKAFSTACKRAYNDCLAVFKKFSPQRRMVFSEMIRNQLPEIRHERIFEYEWKTPKSEALQIIISLTSFPGRIKTVNQTVETLLAQTWNADRIVLWLAESQFPKKERELPKKLLALRERGLEIRWCEDLRSYKKLVPALKEFPNDIIVTADDDLLYPRNWLEPLVFAFLKNPNHIHTRRAHEVAFANTNTLAPYAKWEKEIGSRPPSFNNFPTSGGGCLFPPNSLHDDVLDVSKFQSLCPNGDDIWFWAMAVKKGTKINVPEAGFTLHFVEGTQNVALWKENVNGGENDRALSRILETYPEILEKLDRIYPSTTPKSPRVRKDSRLSAGSLETEQKHLPRFWVRLGAMFIWNKAARKRWREEHMDLTPRNGIDIHAHPELRRDSALKRLAVRTATLFIFSKSKRKAFRAKHLNLAPRDGVDVESLSPEARRLRKQKKRERNPLRRLFNALVPATRSKLSHAEKRLTRHMEWQTQQLLTALKTSQAQAERRVNEGRLSLKRELENDLSKALKTTLDSLANARREFSEVAQSTATLIKRADCLAQAQKELRTAAIESYSRIEKHTPNSLEFRTFGDLAHCIRKHLHKIPADVDLIVGIPRSGMIPAYTIALFMNKKCCSLDEFLAGCEVSNGYRPLTKTEVRKVLVVDDSCYSGRAIDTARERLAALAGKYEFVYAAVYGRTASLDKVDCCLEIVDGKRVWQWNYLNHSIAQAACFDMDGVLCVDPTPEENDDGPKYLNFIKNTAPLYIPTYKIRAVVTSRLEKYREATEAWLREHGVQYDELVMLNMATAEERRQANCHAKFKAEAYKKRTGTTLFVESEDRQAKEIAFLTGKEVLCVTTDELY